MSPRRSFKRLNLDWFVAASVDSFFLLPPLASFFDFDDDDPSHSNADDAFSFLSPAQVLLWSVVLVPGDANSVWNVSAQQCYRRETGISNRSNDNRISIPSQSFRSVLEINTRISKNICGEKKSLTFTTKTYNLHTRNHQIRGR